MVRITIAKGLKVIKLLCRSSMERKYHISWKLTGIAEDLCCADGEINYLDGLKFHFDVG